MESGSLVGFKTYLDETPQIERQPLLWSREAVNAALCEAPHGERGTLALSSSAANGDHTVAPGISATLQRVDGQATTRPHAHSFWHLYIVLSGRGSMRLGTEPMKAIGEGDVLFVPSWCDHSLSAEQDGMLLLSLQNLPGMAALGCLARRDESSTIKILGTSAVAQPRPQEQG